jgi:hypothetical protein
MEGGPGKERPEGKAPPGGRALRFAIRVPLRYRAPGQPTWQQGRTENVSRSGVLFEAEGPVDERSVIEMQLMLGREEATPGATMWCFARVVRSAAPSATGAAHLFAAAFCGYRLVPPGRPSGTERTGE